MFVTSESLQVPNTTVAADPDVVRAVRAELERRGARETHHGQWSLFEHLTSTSRILERWRQPADVCLAGLLHSVYSTDVFSGRLFAADERDAVRVLAGYDAERLAHLFCVLDRRALFQTLERRTERSGAALSVSGRNEGDHRLLTPADVGSLLVLYMANEAEQSARPGGEPGFWLSTVAQLGAWARQYITDVPPVFDRCTATISRSEERALADTYTAALAADASHRAEVLAELASLVASRPWVGEPFIALGYAALAGGEVEQAAARGSSALAILHDWATPWDKRMAYSRWTGLAQFLVRAGSVKRSERDFIAKRTAKIVGEIGLCPIRLYSLMDAVGAFETAPAAGVRPLREAAAPAPPALVSPAARPAPKPKTATAQLPARFAQYMTGFGKSGQRPMMSHYPGLTHKPWHDASEFPLARDLEANAAAIMEEIRNLDSGRFHNESESIKRSGQWDVLMLFERGLRRDENCALLPVTSAVLERNRIVRTLAGLVYVSKMAPHTHIAAHYGPTNMRVRCHLGIDIPDDCGLTVGNVRGTWREGRCVVFDDSFEHDAWNASERERIVLIVDVWHPDLTGPEVELLEGLHLYAAAHGENLSKYWSNNMSARRRVGMME